MQLINLTAIETLFQFERRLLKSSRRDQEEAGQENADTELSVHRGTQGKQQRVCAKNGKSMGNTKKTYLCQNNMKGEMT